MTCREYRCLTLSLLALQFLPLQLTGSGIPTRGPGQLSNTKKGVNSSSALSLSY